MDAVDRADLDARGVLRADARLADHVRHGSTFVRFSQVDVGKISPASVSQAGCAKLVIAMDLPSRPDDVLAQPTRARLFAVLSELGGRRVPRSSPSASGCIPTACACTSSACARPGSSTRERTRQARGRPRDMWAIAPDAQPGGDPPSAYADLGRWLARVIAPGRPALRAVEATGREIGHDLAPEDDAARPRRGCTPRWSSLGFRPAARGRPRRRADLPSVQLPVP